VTFGAILIIYNSLSDRDIKYHALGWPLDCYWGGLMLLRHSTIALTISTQRPALVVARAQSSLNPHLVPVVLCR
jgi:hypothetical protein